MAILIDELMKDRELMGWYIILFLVGADDEKLTNERVEELTDTIFGECDEEEIRIALMGIKEQTDYAKDVVELLKRRPESMGATSEE